MATLEQREAFTHAQLDTTQQSIRVISIDPELSAEGFVQCSIRHTNIDTQYNCLSYRWGSPTPSHILIINGRKMRVNQSLHDFLLAVRTFKYQEQSHEAHLRDNLWIDAICIDQNSGLEKNHQVAQMGKIYMNATKVVMWLGKNDRISSEILSKTTLRDYFGFVWFNEYWTRAWIAQEVILAKDPVLMTANHLISFPDFVKEYINFEWLSRWSAWLERSSDMDLKSTDMYGVLRAWIKWGAYLGYTTKPGITEWLNKLQDVNCTLIHDRIFSLLELCEEGRHIPVDYNMPRSELVYRVLNARYHRVCLCEIFLLNHLLMIGEDETFDTSSTCVYAQWKPDPSGRVCHTTFKEKKTKFWKKLGKMTNEVPRDVQVPLQKLATRESIGLCSGAITGKARIPVQLGYGRVHDWQLVSEDGKVEKLHDGFADSLLETQYASSDSEDADFFLYAELE